MPISWIPFDGWRPSASIFGEGWQTVTDLWPVYNSNRPARLLAAQSPAVLGPLVGSHTHLWPTGMATNSYLPDGASLFTGSPTKLYSFTPAGAFTDLSRGAGYGGVSVFSAGWRFVSIGNDIFAFNHYDVPQRRTANAGNFADALTSTFVPVPRFGVAVREHLLVANLANAGRRPDEIAWSDADNALNFDPPTLTSTSIAGSKVLPSPAGQITGLVGGQYALVFKRGCILYLEYTGSSQIFRPDVLSESVGTPFPSSIIKTRYGIFFVGADGVYQMQGLAEPQHISPLGVDERIIVPLSNRAASAGFAPDPITESLEDRQMVAFHIPQIPLIGWLYRDNWQDYGNTKMIAVNPVSGAWVDSTGTAYLASEQKTTFTWSRPEGFSQWDTMGAFTFDSLNAHVALLSTLQVRSSTIALNFRPSSFEDLNQYQQSAVFGVLPVFTNVAGSAVAPSVTVESLLDPFSFPAAPATSETRVSTDRNISGFYPFQIAGRFFRVTVTTPATDFADFAGLYLDVRPLS